MRGVPIVVIAALFGHSDTCMTQRHYARRRPILPRRCDNRSARSASPPRLLLVGLRGMVTPIRRPMGLPPRLAVPGMMARVARTMLKHPPAASGRTRDRS